MLIPRAKYSYPLPMLVDFIDHFFSSTRPNFLDLSSQLGFARTGAMQNLFSWLVAEEAKLGYKLMSKTRLSGQVEGDGTALRLFRTPDANNYVALWGLAQRPRGASVCKKVLYFVPVKKVKDNAVCPVESYQDVKSTAGLDHVTEHVTTSGKMSSLLITDGARCYLRLAKEFKLKHRFCVHSAGDWNHTAKVKGYGNVEVNTGLVDQMWTDVKRWVPKNITARNKEGDVNNLLWCYVYQWWLRTSISDLTARRQKLYKEWSHQCK